MTSIKAFSMGVGWPAEGRALAIGGGCSGAAGGCSGDNGMGDTVQDGGKGGTGETSHDGTKNELGDVEHDGGLSCLVIECTGSCWAGIGGP
jgi:hypothetical protein